VGSDGETRSTAGQPAGERGSETLAPGVFVEETSLRSRAIEGIATDVAGFAGACRLGPTVCPGSTGPREVTSQAAFERLFGDDEALLHGGGPRSARPATTAQAARAFFENGGRRLFVARVFRPRPDDPGLASAIFVVDGTSAAWRARWPGLAGNALVETRIARSGDLATESPVGIQARRARAGAVVELTPAGSAPAGRHDELDAARLCVVEEAEGGSQTFVGADGLVTPAAGDAIRLVELELRVTYAGGVEVALQLGAHPDQPRYVGVVLDRDVPDDPDFPVWFDWDPRTASLPAARVRFLPARLLLALQAARAFRLSGGNDGLEPEPEDLAAGLESLGEVGDVSQVALPGAAAYADPARTVRAAELLVAHVEGLRDRFALLDAPHGSTVRDVRAFAARFDSQRAALYHPWLEPGDGPGGPVPPSGAIAGVYARRDAERGVHVAPANADLRGFVGPETELAQAEVELLAPEGINPLLTLPGRGFLVWGARTLSSDPEWKYVNVRRLFDFLEHSIQRGTEWVVFEPNGEALWASVRSAVENFLAEEWRAGAFQGERAEEAYFVRCDRSTMTENDLHQGRLVCLIGVAPLRPAEFVVFRIGQFTADAGA